MRRASATWAAAVQHGSASLVEVTSWYAGQRLATVPVVSASWSVIDSCDAQTGGTLAFDVPAKGWKPTRPEDPLAGCGQLLRLRIGQRTGRTVEWVPAGVFQARPATLNGDVLHVEGVTALKVAEESRLIGPMTFAGRTRGWAVRRLLQGIAPVRVAVADEAMPAWTCEQDRLAGLVQITDAWPARMMVDDLGTVVVAPVFNDDSPGSPLITVTDGPGGTLVDVQPAEATGNRYNAYRVTSVPEDGSSEPVSETWQLPTGPFRWGGPFGYQPSFFESPLLPRDRAKLRSVARAMTLRAQRRMDAYTVTAAPDARMQAGDVVRVKSSADGLDFIGRALTVEHRWDRLTAKVSWLAGSR